ncbi:MAG: M23 family metallopeptidase [Pseudomonadota bacterium]
MTQFLNKSTQKSKLAILTQNLLHSLRKIKMRWVSLILVLPFFAIIAAFGTVSSEQPRYVKPEIITEEVTLPLAVRNVNRDEEFWQIDQVRRDDTLASIFRRMGIRDEDAMKFLMLSPDARAMNNQLIPGHTLEIKTNLDGRLLHLEYEVDHETILVAGLTPSGYQVATQKLILQNHQVLKSAIIVDSLFSATDDAGIPDQIALQIADIFSSEIDFHDDLRPGDYFNVVYEAFYNAGEMMKLGNVLAVEFVNQGKKYQAVHFGDAEGKFAYYTPEGKSLHKSFLRSPLEFTRISSSFSAGRFHPILNRIKAHRGVDMAAPTGTRIKASGNGVVDFVGRKGGYGNVIVLKHENGISTVYGHLSRFTPGLRRGMQVAQGDIIGFVGMTGLATGPHLHYEFLLNKVHRDPMTVALPTSVPLEGKYKKEFDALSLNLMAQIEMLNRRQSASTD